MIDPENAIFTEIANALREKIPGVNVYGEYTEVPSGFPCVTIIEAENKVVQSRRDLRDIEHAVVLLFEVNCYSNLVGKKKSQAKEMMEIVDEHFKKMGFQRVTLQQMPNINNGTIYRLFARYQGVDEPRIENEDEVHWIFGVH